MEIVLFLVNSRHDLVAGTGTNISYQLVPVLLDHRHGRKVRDENKYGRGYKGL